MKIALIASKGKKELMTQFCIAYRRIFSQHTIIASASLGRTIAEEASLNIEYVQSMAQGEEQQIASRIEYNEIDLVIYFRDTILNRREPDTGHVDSNSIIRMCDKNNIPVATNIATAEVLVLALDRGDFDWRNYVRK